MPVLRESVTRCLHTGLSNNVSYIHLSKTKIKFKKQCLSRTYQLMNLAWLIMPTVLASARLRRRAVLSSRPTWA